MYNARYSMFTPYLPLNSASQYHLYGYLRQQPMSYKSLQEALALIKQAVAGEREDELFYDYLISVAPSQEEKEIIQGIRDDERKHNRMFRSPTAITAIWCLKSLQTNWSMQTITTY